MHYRVAAKEDQKALTALWQEAFLDTKDTISLFMKTCFRAEYTVVAEEQNQIAAAIYLLEAELPNHQNFFYVYAAATKKSFQKQGIMTALLDYAKEFAKQQGKAGLYLVPANEKLFAYYKKRGYENAFLKDVYSIEKADFLAQYPLESKLQTAPILHAKAYQEIRQKNLMHLKAIQYPLETLQLDLDFAKHFESSILQTENGFCHMDFEEDTLQFSEFIMPNLEEQRQMLSKAFLQYPTVKNVLCILPHDTPFFMDSTKKTIPAGMILPLQDKTLTEKNKTTYLGITLG